MAGIAAWTMSLSTFWQASALRDITKPYLGEYECKSATLGKKDLLETISSVVIELRADHTFVLRYRNKKGKKHEETGSYEYDAERKTVRFTRNGLLELTREFTLENGVLYGCMKIGWETLTISFEQK